MASLFSHISYICLPFKEPVPGDVLPVMYPSDTEQVSGKYIGDELGYFNDKCRYGSCSHRVIIRKWLNFHHQPHLYRLNVIKTCCWGSHSTRLVNVDI